MLSEVREMNGDSERRVLTGDEAAQLEAAVRRNA
jgi:hypothetical protein